MTLNIQRSFDEAKNSWSMILSGELDISSAPAFREALNQAYLERKADIVLYFDQLAYIDSTGLGVIIGALGRMKENENGITIENPGAGITKLLRITKLDTLLCPQLCE